MTLTEKYRFRSGGHKVHILIFILIIAIIMTIATTFSRYKRLSSSSAVLTFAKWNISVNDTVISNSQNNSNIEVPIVIENGLEDNIIRNGNTGYFEIEIDPTDTEVGVEYTINLSFVKLPSNLLSNMLFESYSLDGGTTKNNISNNSISGNILLGSKASLDSNDVKTYRVYWRWVGSDLDTNPGDCKINTNVTVRQVV